MQKLLSEMEGQKNRSARFRTVISLILDGEEYSFEGKVVGEILSKRDYGFGYDPIFKPFGYDQSFAEMTIKQRMKSAIEVWQLKNFFIFYPIIHRFPRF